MPGTRFAWLHLTDLHYGLKGQGCFWPNLRQPFLDDLARLHQRCGPWDAVLFTGDLVQSGAPEQYTAMQQQVLSPFGNASAGSARGIRGCLPCPATTIC